MFLKQKHPSSNLVIPSNKRRASIRLGSAKKTPEHPTREKDAPNNFYMIDDKLNLSDLIFVSNEMCDDDQLPYLDQLVD